MSNLLIVSTTVNILIAIILLTFLYKGRKENSVENRYYLFIQRIALSGDQLVSFNFKCGNGCYLEFINQLNGTFTLKYWCAHERNRLYKFERLSEVLRVLNNIRLIVITDSTDMKINNALFDLAGDPDYD